MEKLICQGPSYILTWYHHINFEKTERQKDKKTERQKDRKIERQKDRKTERKCRLK